jgi:hypothetical protein
VLGHAENLHRTAQDARAKQREINAPVIGGTVQPPGGRRTVL